MSSSILEGVRVISLTSVWAGPWAGSVLADMGAEVIKVESSRKLDNLRYMVTLAETESGVNKGAFNIINRGTKSCTIDLSQPKGATILKQLVGVSDVVIENFAPRVMFGLGIDYTALKEVKPDIIMVSLSGFGGTGPDKNYVAYASTIEAVGGLNASFGYPGEEPALGAIYAADPIGSMYCVLCVIAALYSRHKTGKGQHVDISETEALISTIPEVVMEYTMNGRVRPRMGNRDEIMAPHGCYPCKGEDKWVAIAVSTDEEWRALCRAMGNPRWSKDERFADQYRRWQNQDKLDELIGEWTRNFTHYEVMYKLQDVGVAAGPSFNTEELVNDLHIKERGAIIKQNHPEAGETLVYRSPWASSETKDNPPAPRLGEHNSYVFKDLLGLSDKELAQLIDEKVVY
jgi:crotonobetainyl-CoA:carnitine CoA-transferase CaiB-like acyl-CoA transferase